MRPSPLSEPAAGAREELDGHVRRLADRRRAWVAVDRATRIDYLEQAVRGLAETADAWVRDACLARKADVRGPVAGEEWLAGPWVVLRCLRQYAQSLAAGGHPTALERPDAPGGQAVRRVFPLSRMDRLLFYNLSADVWIRSDRPASQGRIYRDGPSPESPGGLTLVLGAGNISSIGPLDVLYQLFVENRVVLLKMNPVNDYLAPHLERTFASLIASGYLSIVKGDAGVGAYLAHHPSVSAVHLTGSRNTYDALVWGTDPEERDRRKRGGRPALAKPVTAELGCVTPVIVVPGDWSPAELDFQARQVASMVSHNSSFNCNAAKVLVLDRGWGQRDAFVERLRVALAATATRYPYYPGARERYEAFVRHYPGAERLGPPVDDRLPWTLIPDVTPDAQEYALSTEAFCGVLALVDLEAHGARRFTEQVVPFVNGHISGTLSCVVLIDPATRRELGDLFERTVASLRYGCVAINVWAGAGYALPAASWGAFPGNTPEDVGSGIGVVHNGFFFDHVEKTVIDAPFRLRPKPAWLSDHRNPAALGRHLFRFELDRRWRHLLPLTWTALRG